MEPWAKAIAQHKLLNKERTGTEWWSSNIVDSSRELTEKRDWALFYSYLANPQTFDPTILPVTLDDLHVIPDQIEKYPSELREERIQNGNVTHINIVRVENSSSDDEKVQ